MTDKPKLRWVDPPISPRGPRGYTAEHVQSVVDAVLEGEGQWALIATYAHSSGPGTTARRWGAENPDAMKLVEARGAKLTDAVRGDAPTEHRYGMWMRAAGGES